MAPSLSQLTICCPVTRDDKWPGILEAEINHQLDQFGNPVGGSPRPGPSACEAASTALKDALDKTGCIHFLSVSFIPGHEAGERSYLVLEASVDGGASHSLDRLCRAGLPALLLPIFQTACDARSADQVARLLRKYRVRELTNQIPNFNLNRRSATGLFFRGAGGQTVHEIETSRDVHDICRAGVDELVAADRRRDTTTPSRKLAMLTSLFTAENDAPGNAALKARLAKRDSRVAELLSEDRFPKIRAFVQQEIERRRKFPAEKVRLPFADRPIGKKATSIEEVSFTAQAFKLAGLFWKPISAVTLMIMMITAIVYVIPTTSLSHLLPWVDAGEQRYSSLSLLASVGAAVAITLILSLTSLILLGWLLHRALRKAERANAKQPFEGAPDIETVRQMMLRENRLPIQNHMISITRIQRSSRIGGWLRRHLFLPLAFRAVREAAANNWFRDGFLADIGTIHFARWVVLRGTRNVVFLSNYNSNWESYLEDFITKAPQGLTGVWGNTDGFPETRNLFDEGARNGDAFKRFARASMIPTRLWYARYPEISVNQARRNAIIVSGLGTDVNRSFAEAWLDLFDSHPRPAEMLEFEDIQTLVFSGVPKLRSSACQVVRFPETVSQGSIRRWIADMDRHLTTGRQAPADRACFVAFSKDGLDRLAIHTSLSTHTSPNQPTPTNPMDCENGDFAPAFKLGMDHRTRSNVLFDVADNAPEHWIWGNSSAADGRADAVVLIYWNGLGDSGEDYASEIRKLIEARGLEAGPLIAMQNMVDGPFKEPFGWVDGISQPRLRGVDPQPLADPLNTVEPGEFVLGYRDNRGHFPATALIPAEKDPDNLLPLPPDRLPGDYPDFSRDCPVRDFGRNGSYLVIRQLEQFKDKFDAWCQREADDLNDKLVQLSPAERDKLVPGGRVIDQEYVGAKVFGRWKNGQPLVRYPRKPRERNQADRAGKNCKPRDEYDTDNEVLSSFTKHRLNAFRYADEDPQGHNCPFGAHIRRANPRDSLNPDNPNAIAIANRHRLLRRGRSFEIAANGNEQARQGTFFMCLNADIERQFEFIQQNWLNSAAFHDLVDETDVIAGQTFGPSAYRTFSIQSAGGAATIKGWDSFTRMLGGGYFFMPGRRAFQYLACTRETHEAPGIIADDEAPSSQH